MPVVWTVVVIALVVLFLLSLAVKVVKQYEQGVLFRLGRVIGIRQLPVQPAAANGKPLPAAG